MRTELLALFLLGCAAPPPAAAPAVAIAAPPAPPAPPPREVVASTSAPQPVITTPATTPKEKPASAPATVTTKNDALAQQILEGSSGATLKKVLADPAKYRFQVLYGLVTEKGIQRHGYRTDAEYFFPASSMKMPITLALYDRAPAMKVARDATMKIHPVNGSGDPYVTTLARETSRALIVSDNFSANRLLAIVGHREVHETLWSLGLASARVRTGFATGADIDPAELSPRIDVGDATLAPRKSDLALPPNDATNLEIGKEYIGDGGRKINSPMPFAMKNAMKLSELQDTLVRIMRPDLLPPSSKKDTMTKEDLAFLQKTLGTLPSESGLAGYDRNVVADYQLDPFLRGIERVRARGKFEVHVKVGQAYGFLIGNAYVIDKETGRSFFLTAAIFANNDDTMNDDTYLYDAISFPALADVGEAFARHTFE